MATLEDDRYQYYIPDECSTDPVRLFTYGSTGYPIEIYEEMYKKNGHNPNTPDENGNTILEYIIWDFFEYGMIMNDYTKKFIEMLIRYGLDINSKNNDGDTILHCISDMDTYRIDVEHLIYFLVEKGADPTIKNAKKKVPFFDHPSFRKCIMKKWKTSSK